MPQFLNVRTILPALIASAVFAEGAVGKTPEIGDVAPEWSQLKGTDGTLHSLSDLAAMDVIIVCFTCNSCPYSVDYEDRMIALQKQYADKKQRVRLVAINSNLVPADSMDEMKKRAAEKHFNFSYLQDETQAVARAYGAIYTPEFFVLNKGREIVYKGAMDDSTKAKDVKSNYVDLAVAAALNGQLPQVTKSGARGCAIRFKRRRR